MDQSERSLPGACTSHASYRHYFVGVVEDCFFLPKSFVRPVLLRSSVPLLRSVSALPFNRLLTSAVMTGFSAVPVMLIGIPVASDGLAASDVLFNFVRILTPTLLSPLALA